MVLNKIEYNVYSPDGDFLCCVTIDCHIFFNVEDWRDFLVDYLFDNFLCFTDYKVVEHVIGYFSFDDQPNVNHLIGVSFKDVMFSYSFPL